MDKKSLIVKKVPATGTKVDSERDLPRRVVMKIKDGETGKTKCAAFVEIADTDALRRKGLSKRASLGRMSGMFFATEAASRAFAAAAPAGSRA